MRKCALFTVIAVTLVVPLVAASMAQSSERPKKQTPPAAPSAAPKDAKPGDQGMPEMPGMPPPPGEHHKWLDQLIGTWSVETEMIPGEGQPPMKATGTDVARSIGGRWVIAELNAEMPGMGTMNAMLTLGFNPETGKYQGTWVDSMTDHLWVYVGTLDPTKKILTLEAEGPNMKDPTKGNMKYRDVIEIKSADHRTLTSSVLDDGKWVKIVSANYRRK